MPYHGRGLTSVTVSTFAELETELAGSAATIRLAAGTYSVASTLTIARDVTLTADVEGSSVVLDGGNARGVMTINSGTVQLTGLTITNGYASVRHRVAHVHYRSCVPKAGTVMRSLLDLTFIAPICSIAPMDELSLTFVASVVCVQGVSRLCLLNCLCLIHCPD